MESRNLKSLSSVSAPIMNNSIQREENKLLAENQRSTVPSVLMSDSKQEHKQTKKHARTIRDVCVCHYLQEHK